MIESTGMVPALADSITMAALGGTLLMFGIVTKPEGTLPLYQLYYKEITIVNGRAAKGEDFPASIDLVARGAVKLDPLVTHTLPLADLETAIQMVGSDAGDRMKIIFQNADNTRDYNKQGNFMRVIDEKNITEIAIEQMSTTDNPRLKQIMAALVKHLHEFAREVDLTPEEWIYAIGFLTQVGQTCTAFRQEFVLLSDVLGFSSLINSLNDRRIKEGRSAQDQDTKSSLLGPFYREDSPKLPLGESIAAHDHEPEIVYYGRVLNAAGRGHSQRLHSGLADQRRRQVRHAGLWRRGYRRACDVLHRFGGALPFPDGPPVELSDSNRRSGRRSHPRAAAPRHASGPHALFDRRSRVS